MITDNEAKALAGLWHSGLMSYVYRIACNDSWEKLTRADWLGAYYDMANNLRDAVADKDRVNERECKALCAWIKAKAASYGYSIAR